MTRQLVKDFYRVRLTRDPVLIGPFLDHDVDWLISGPIELFPFCGQKRGRSAVLNLITQVMPSLLEVVNLDVEAVLIDGDMASTFNRITAVQLASGRTISYRQAQFLRFEDGRIVWYRGLIDSFDAAEQMIGRPIALAETGSNASAGDLIAV